MDIINYVCRLCNYSEQIPKDVVRYFDLMDDGDPTVPPRFSCKYCAGEMYPAEKWNDIEGEDDFDEDKMISKYFPLLKVSKVGRNDLCPCGSGKKYKRCCGNR